MKNRCFHLLLVTFALLPCPIEAGQESNPSNLGYIGIVYYLEPSAKLLVLDRQIPRPKASIKAFGFGGARAIVELDAERASLRLPSNQELSFVVDLPNGVDPREFQLYQFAARNGKRQLVITSGSVFKGQQVRVAIQINISRYGENSYKLTPSGKLAAGEYAFIAGGSGSLGRLKLPRDDWLFYALHSWVLAQQTISRSRSGCQDD